jgi:thymidylate synthase (FAD)
LNLNYGENVFDGDHKGRLEHIIVTTNLRVLQENGWLDDLKYLCEPTEFHEKRLSVKVITDIGVTREFNRHRTFSIVEQSTRYCNFSKDKFGNELTFIIPEYWKEYYRVTLSQNDEYSCKNSGNGILMLNQNQETVDWNFVRNKMLCETLINLLDIENHYIFMTSYTYNGKTPYKPEQARQILPLCTKTEVVYTAFESDWRHFFDLRLFGKTGEPHPQMKQLAELIKQEFEKAGVWEGIMKYPSKYET